MLLLPAFVLLCNTREYEDGEKSTPLSPLICQFACFGWQVTLQEAPWSQGVSPRKQAACKQVSAQQRQLRASVRPAMEQFDVLLVSLELQIRIFWHIRVIRVVLTNF